MKKKMTLMHLLKNFNRKMLEKIFLKKRPLLVLRLDQFLNNSYKPIKLLV